jgi:hypothetical protein
LSSFRYDRTGAPETLVKTLRELREKGLQLDESKLADEADVYVGDLVADGSGEIYLWHVANAA